MSDTRTVPTQILVARHPETVANAGGRFLGRGESPFTPKGERQADALVSCLTVWEPTRVHTSPRERARTIATRVAEATGVPLAVDDGLAEMDFGAAEGLTYEETTLRGIDIDLLGGPVDSAPFESGESWRSFLDRVVRAAERAEVPGARVAIVAHGGVVRALVTLWMGLPHEAAWRFAVPNATTCTLSVWEGEGTLLTFGVPAGECAWECGA